METVKVAIGEMTAPQLSWTLATLFKYEILIGAADGTVFVKNSYGWQIFCPATTAVQAWPLMDKYGISTECAWPDWPQKKTWTAGIGLTCRSAHKDGLMAAMMTLVKHLANADFVDIPEITLMQLNGE